MTIINNHIVKEFIEEDFIEVAGAREHNLKNIDVKIPRNKLVVITGISGSGKSSLAFDTIYAEGQRRYMETFSAYVRQFIGNLDRPEVEKIEGLSPVISIEQKTIAWNPRSTVGTTTEIYDLLRLLFARCGEAYSHITGKILEKFTERQILERIFTQFSHQKIILLAPIVRGRKGHYRELFEQMRKKGFTKMRVNGQITDLQPKMQLDRYKTHDIELVVDRLLVEPDRKDRIVRSLQLALNMGNDFIWVLNHDTNKIVPFSKKMMDPESGLAYDEPSPNTFSFNSPYGACPSCKGLGVIHQVDMQKLIPNEELSLAEQGIAALGEVRDNLTFKQLKVLAKKYNFDLNTPIRDIPKSALNTILYGGDDIINTQFQFGDLEYSYNLAQEGIVNMLERWYQETTSEKIRKWAEEYMSIAKCSDCQGYRLKKESMFFRIGNRHIGELAEMDLHELNEWIRNSKNKLTDHQRTIGEEVIKEIQSRLRFLLDVGLGYLSLNRPTRTLSGGESQRIRLATQIGSQLTGITYIMDEPSIGLHQRDNQRLITALHHLRDIGNTVIVVEHDKDIMLSSDYIIDLGPGAGEHGGFIVGQGHPAEFLNIGGITADFLKGRKMIEANLNPREGNGKEIILYGAKGHNLKDITIHFPLGKLICVAGVSGSGKSTLINETLYPILRQHLYRSTKNPLPYADIAGIEYIDKVIEIDQNPIGRTPRSNPATYTGLFTDIRKIFAELPESKIRGYKPGRFSFNVKGGRCEVCQGAGMKVIEMNFLPDVLVDCESCMGRRYNIETLEVLYKGKSIYEVLEMPVQEALEFFKSVPSLFRKLKTMYSVGLGYITLGQQATTLSGGEAQRVKLSEELSRKDTGNTLYILDEPTTGLHFQDIQQLIGVLNQLVDKGNTVLVIEHNLDIIKVADYIIDLGPEGGTNGGSLVTEGTVLQLINCSNSYTGSHLSHELCYSSLD
ncbi:MAG TPA: excinuclease ABC subunit UvrA [Saprospiraceae bacterium]|mgnify:FL=1|nr:excinuclease ABC subunit UvrA [Saprospiraceae bacterium]